MTRSEGGIRAEEIVEPVWVPDDIDVDEFDVDEEMSYADWRDMALMKATDLSVRDELQHDRHRPLPHGAGRRRKATQHRARNGKAGQ